MIYAKTSEACLGGRDVNVHTAKAPAKIGRE